MTPDDELLADLAALAAAGPRALWQMFTDRPDVAEAALAAGRAAGVDEDDPAFDALCQIVEAQREAAAAGQAPPPFRLVDPAGQVDVFVPGVSPN